MQAHMAMNFCAYTCLLALQHTRIIEHIVIMMFSACCRVRLVLHVHN